ncbi:hypothetical protein ACFE04_006105 [Oxalis oulophora]
MLPLPPPPPRPPSESSSTPFATPPPQLPTPPPPRRLKTDPLAQTIKSKRVIYKQSLPLEIEPLSPSFKRLTPSHSPILWHHHSRKTSPLTWLSVILCFIFSLLLIFFGVATLIIFLIIQPKIPVFDTPNASLRVIYFDAPEYFNGDFAFVANFSNPNRKIDVRFEYLEVELFFFDRLIAMQVLQPFKQRKGEIRLEEIHMISSLVYLPQRHAVELRKQVMSNRITYEIRGSFKVKASLGSIHYSYWIHGKCQLQMTGPPTGGLVARNCTTKR